MSHQLEFTLHLIECALRDMKISVSQYANLAFLLLVILTTWAIYYDSS